MIHYAIIETDEGLTVAEIPESSNPEETAASHGALLIDPGPFDSYEAAYDAMMSIPDSTDQD
ncbi:MAG: hypothetical protein JW818_07655 [Pirellulales bacterium]|nr:hypothetical protein [Pirellulales bacterium]